ncbi:hypothetical protein SCLCIDRAFT_23924 [Scleroderma citrinum Foug A]|uniref:Uncharacterized protein n=1 Tax=Scleroderma citrinum Foug A TaxID=1036808 RepID=A0A0C3E5L5_9AGAM|nr:hypothetical protein SCLCIDRAFT_23924 [Scleroderma citrinum Foug A]
MSLPLHYDLENIAAATVWLYVAVFVGNMFTTAMKAHSILVPEAIFSHRTTPVALISDLLH